MKAIILAAGKGNRIADFTNNRPKCLLKLGKENILERENRILFECGISSDNIYTVTGFGREELLPYCYNEIYNPMYEDKDNSYSLGLALEKVFDDNVIVMDSDLCFDAELIMELLNDSRDNVLLSKLSSDLSESTGILTGSELKVKAIGKQYKNTGYVYISIFKFGRALIPKFREYLLMNENTSTWYTSAITKLCDKYPFYNRVTSCRWHEIDFKEDYYDTLNEFNLG